MYHLGLYGNSFEIKLGGFPWATSGHGGTTFELCRMLMTRLLLGLETRGWKVACSADVSSKHDNNGYNSKRALDVNTWFVAYRGQTQVPSVAAAQSYPVPSAPTLPSPHFVCPHDAPPSYEEAVRTSSTSPLCYGATNRGF